MQFTLTNDFTPSERALLHATILHVYKENKATRQAQKIENTINKLAGPTKLFAEFYDFTDATMQQLLKKLFHDCFIEDLDFVSEFAKQRKQVLINADTCVNG